MSSEHKWWWEINRENITVEYEDEDGDPVLITPVFSSGTEDIPEDEPFILTVDDLEFTAQADESSVELASDEVFTTIVSHEAAYAFGFLAGLRKPIALPQRTWIHLQTLISACVGDYSKLEALSDVDRKDLVTALSVIMHKSHPIPQDEQPRPVMQVLTGGGCEEGEEEEENLEPDYSDILQQIDLAYNKDKAQES